MIPCPCCSQPVFAPTAEMVIDHLRIPGLQARILYAVWRGNGEPVPFERIIALMDSPDTKTHSYTDFKIALCHLRRKLRPAGIEIKNVGYRQGYCVKFQSKGQLHVS